MRSFKGETERQMRDMAWEDAKAAGVTVCHRCCEEMTQASAKLPKLFDSHYKAVCDTCADELERVIAAVFPVTNQKGQT